MKPRRKRQNKKPQVDMARIIIDTRDGSKDKFIPRSEARALFENGKLAIDVTNSVYENVYCYPTTK